jgi:hypothetical protein
MQIAEFVAKYTFGITTRRADSNPSMANSQDMDHWKVTLIAPKSASKLFDRMTLTFSMGRGHNGKSPTVEEVLNAIALDCSALDMQLEEFQAEFGYDDVRKARKTWNACRKEALKFQNAFGKSKLDELRTCEPL